MRNGECGRTDRARARNPWAKGEEEVVIPATGGNPGGEWGMGATPNRGCCEPQATRQSPGYFSRSRGVVNDPGRLMQMLPGLSSSALVAGPPSPV